MKIILSISQRFIVDPRSQSFQLKKMWTRRPRLDGVFIPQIIAEIGLLIASDVPKALDPLEVKHSQNSGPYATRTHMGWHVSGPLGCFPGRSHKSNFFFKVEPQLQQMVERFYNRDFVDLFADDTEELSQDEHRFIRKKLRRYNLRKPIMKFPCGSRTTSPRFPTKSHTHWSESNG